MWQIPNTVKENLVLFNTVHGYNNQAVENVFIHSNLPQQFNLDLGYYRHCVRQEDGKYYQAVHHPDGTRPSFDHILHTKSLFKASSLNYEVDSRIGLPVGNYGGIHEANYDSEFIQKCRTRTWLGLTVVRVKGSLFRGNPVEFEIVKQEEVDQNCFILLVENRDLGVFYLDTLEAFRANVRLSKIYTFQPLEKLLKYNKSVEILAALTEFFLKNKALAEKSIDDPHSYYDTLGFPKRKQLLNPKRIKLMDLDLIPKAKKILKDPIANQFKTIKSKFEVIKDTLDQSKRDKIQYERNLVSINKALADTNKVIEREDKHLLAVEPVYTDLKTKFEEVIKNIDVTDKDFAKKLLANNIYVNQVVVRDKTTRLTWRLEQIQDLVTIGNYELDSLMFSTIIPTKITRVSRDHGPLNTNYKFFGSTTFHVRNGGTGLYVYLADLGPIACGKREGCGFKPVPHTSYQAYDEYTEPFRTAFNGCLGELSPIMSKAAQTLDINKMINGVMSWASTAYINDPWGREVDYFPSLTDPDITTDRKIVVNDNGTYIAPYYFKYLKKNDNFVLLIEKDNKIYLQDKETISEIGSLKKTRELLTKMLSDGWEEQVVYSKWSSLKNNNKTLEEVYNDFLVESAK